MPKVFYVRAGAFGLAEPGWYVACGSQTFGPFNSKREAKAAGVAHV